MRRFVPDFSCSPPPPDGRWRGKSRRRWGGGGPEEHAGGIQVAVGCLELRLQFHLQPCQIHQIPAGEYPVSIRAIVADSHQPVGGVVADFDRARVAREIKRPQGAVATGFLVEFWIEVDDPSARLMDNTQVGVAAPLDLPGRRMREGTGEVRVFVETPAQSFFEKCRGFVDPAESLDRGIGGIQFRHRGIDGRGNRLDGRDMDRILGSGGDQSVAGRDFDHFRKRHGHLVAPGPHEPIHP